MKRRITFLFAAMLALSASSAFAGLFDDDEARQRIQGLRTSLDALNARVEQMSQNQVDFANQSDALKAELANLRGQIEMLLNQMDATQKRQRDFYVDLDTRLRKLEESTRPVGDPAQEGRDYEAALALFKARKFKEANTAFQTFIATWPNSNSLPSAYYWLGSGYYQLKNFSAASDTFSLITRRWPEGDKAPDAMLALSNTLTESGDTKGAKKALEDLIAHYPDSPAAQTARQYLGKKK